MHVHSMLEVGHQHVMDAVGGIAPSIVELPGACGIWSIKDLVSHLTSFEYVLTDVALSLLKPQTATPYLTRFLTNEQFNEQEVEKRRYQPFEKVLGEYITAQAEASIVLANVPADIFRKAGALPWYGAEYDLEDFIVYSSYAHKREHCGQIAVFVDHVKRLQTIG